MYISHITTLVWNWMLCLSFGVFEVSFAMSFLVCYLWVKVCCRLYLVILWVTCCFWIMCNMKKRDCDLLNVLDSAEQRKVTNLWRGFVLSHWQPGRGAVARLFYLDGSGWLPLRNWTTGTAGPRDTGIPLQCLNLGKCHYDLQLSLSEGRRC